MNRNRDHEPIDVEGVYPDAECVLLTDGTTVPITSWLDKNGEECDPNDAVVCVAGELGRYWSIDLTELVTDVDFLLKQEAQYGLVDSQRH